jgi:hypothetical protein
VLAALARKAQSFGVALFFVTAMDTNSVILGMIFGFAAGASAILFLWHLCSSTFENVSIAPPVETIVNRCQHPFAVCNCNEKFFLLYDDLMFAPERCPSCGTEREAMRILHLTWIENTWRLPQRTVVLKTPSA